MMHRRDGLIFMSIKDTPQGTVKVAKILPTTSTWGVFEDHAELLKELIPEATLESIDRLTRNDPTPFLRTKGLRTPLGCLKLLEIEKSCDEHRSCISFNKTFCTLGHRKMPECFSPSIGGNLRPLILAWKDGFYIVRERHDA
jgi:hypothetical protein